MYVWGVCGVWYVNLCAVCVRDLCVYGVWYVGVCAVCRMCVLSVWCEVCMFAWYLCCVMCVCGVRYVGGARGVWYVCDVCA